MTNRKEKAYYQLTALAELLIAIPTEQQLTLSAAARSGISAICEEAAILLVDEK